VLLGVEKHEVDLMLTEITGPLVEILRRHLFIAGTDGDEAELVAAAGFELLQQVFGGEGVFSQMDTGDGKGMAHGCTSHV